MDHRIKRATRFIEMNYSRRVSLRDLTNCANLSESHFHRLFKLETRLSPAKYLKRVRIFEAAELLHRDEMLLMKEVMNRVGITDKTNFTRSFKEVLGITPTEYRGRLAAKQRQVVQSWSTSGIT